MTRSWSAAAQTALAGDNVPLVIFIEADFISGGVQSYLRLCTAGHDMTWNGYTWTGSGNLLQIAAPEESTQVEALGLSIQMSAVSPALLSLAYSASYQGRALKMWCAVLNADYSFVEVRLVYQGMMDAMTIDDANSTITLTVEHELARLNIPPMGNYNHEDQQIRYPGDLGLQYVTALEKDTEIKWGRS